MMMQIVSHPGECPDCLGGNLWPRETYAFRVEEYQPSSQAASMSDTPSQWWTHSSSSPLPSKDTAPAHFHDMGLTGDTANQFNKVVLRAAYSQFRCHYCDKPPKLGQRCQDCDVTVNAARCLRQSIVENVNRPFDSKTKEEIEAEFDPQRRPKIKLVAHNWPLAREKTLQRYQFGLRVIESLVGEIHPATPRDERHVAVARLVLEVAACFIAYDSGVGTGNIRTILRQLVPMCQPPFTNPERYSWSDQIRKIDVSQLLWAIMAWTSYVPDAEHRTLNARSHHLHAARVRHYTTALELSDISPGWGCAICLAEEVGTAVKLNRCGHMFHLKCLSDWFVGIAGASTACPLCRRTFDWLEPRNNWRMRATERLDDDGVDHVFVRGADVRPILAGGRGEQDQPEQNQPEVGQQEGEEQQPDEDTAIGCPVHDHHLRSRPAVTEATLLRKITPLFAVFVLAFSPSGQLRSLDMGVLMGDPAQQAAGTRGVGCRAGETSG
ncbi:hypothetical protein GE09DRAFT_1226068 [Coniochaeta sp. 2T2.1]|nr:hypothetical protein GE09DRAFT_1226068 [Coniochaeta sp. 2T2.1]